MAYINIDELKKRFGEEELIELSDIGIDQTGEINSEVIAEAITDAEELINSYVGVRHKLPFSQVPSILVRLGCDLARYFLYRSVRPDDVKDAYNNAISTLKAIARGDVILGSALEIKPQPASEVVLQGGGEQVFSSKNMGGF